VGSPPRSHHEVVLQLSPIAVVDQIDAGINILVADLGILSDVGSPFLRIVSNKVVAL
jgi:hypothetical protein